MGNCLNLNCTPKSGIFLFYSFRKVRVIFPNLVNYVCNFNNGGVFCMVYMDFYREPILHISLLQQFRLVSRVELKGGGGIIYITKNYNIYRA